MADKLILPDVSEQAKQINPNQDAMRGMLQEMFNKIAPRTKQAGRAGVIARMQMTFFAALGQCIAGERDFGTTERDIFDCLGVVMGDTVASAVLQQSAGDGEPSIGEQINEVDRTLSMINARAKTVLRAPSEPASAVARDFRVPIVGRG